MKRRVFTIFGLLLTLLFGNSIVPLVQAGTNYRIMLPVVSNYADGIVMENPSYSTNDINIGFVARFHLSTGEAARWQGGQEPRFSDGLQTNYATVFRYTWLEPITATTAAGKVYSMLVGVIAPPGEYNEVNLAMSCYMPNCFLNSTVTAHASATGDWTATVGNTTWYWWQQFIPGALYPRPLITGPDYAFKMLQKVSFLQVLGENPAWEGSLNYCSLSDFALGYFCSNGYWMLSTDGSTLSLPSNIPVNHHEWLKP